MRRKIAAGNWKMHGLGAQLDQLRALADRGARPDCEIWIAPPATLLAPARAIVGNGPVLLGGQTCHAAEAGAHTGDISAAMLADAGARFVILGHSERRSGHGERSVDVRGQARAAHAAGLVALICVGETEAERDAANTLDIISEQLAGSLPDAADATDTVIAYEPVWAIGTGRTPTADQIGEVHDFIRSKLESRLGAGIGTSVRLLYGGSVKGANAADIFAVSNVDGALVGGASLTAADFAPIVAALEAA